MAPRFRFTPPPRSVRLLQLRRMLWPILETAGAAVAAWYLAKLALGDRATNFAPIAAVICLGATLGQQRERALELTAGVVLGVLIADLLVRVIGTGPPQVGVMVVLAMSTAVLVGGGPLLMTESGVSAIIIGSVEPSAVGILPVRPVEGLIGGAVAFVVHLLVFPPDPLLHAGRAANAVIDSLGNTLEDVSSALRTADAGQAAQALGQARAVERDVLALEEALALGRDTTRSAPLRRSARVALDRVADIGRHLDLAGRDTEILARDVARQVRADGAPVPDLADAIDHLARAVWALGAALDEPDVAVDSRRLAMRAMARATEAAARHADLALLQIAGHVRSIAVDLARAADSAMPLGGPSEASTDELLSAPLDEPLR